MTDRNRTDVKVIFALTLIHFAGAFYVSLFFEVFEMCRGNGKLHAFIAVRVR